MQLPSPIDHDPAVDCIHGARVLDIGMADLPYQFKNFDAPCYHYCQFWYCSILEILLSSPIFWPFRGIHFQCHCELRSVDLPYTCRKRSLLWSHRTTSKHYAPINLHCIYHSFPSSFSSPSPFNSGIMMYMYFIYSAVTRFKPTVRVCFLLL